MTLLRMIVLGSSLALAGAAHGQGRVMAIDLAKLKLRTPPIADKPLTGAFNPNLPNLATQPTADVTITINGAGRVKGPGFNCVPMAGKTSTICNRTMAENAPVLLEAIGKDGNVLTAWAGACSGNTVQCAITPKGKMQLAATFGPPPVQQMTSVIVKIPDGAGNVKAGSFTPNAIDCTKTGAGAASGTCNVKVPLGSQVSLIASPAAGSAFNGWESEQPGCGGFECAFTAQDPVVLTARFGSKSATAKLSVSFMRSGYGGVYLMSDPKLTFSCVPAQPPSMTEKFMSTCFADVPTGTIANISGLWIGLSGGMAIRDKDWNGDCIAKKGGVCTVAMTQDRNLLIDWAGY